MDTHMTIRAIIFLVAGLALIAFPRQILRTQLNVVAYLARKFHSKYLYLFVRSGRRHGTSGHIVSGYVFLIISAILFAVARS
jgi:dolichol kinase